jgi:hypothetical protein
MQRQVVVLREGIRGSAPGRPEPLDSATVHPEFFEQGEQRSR